MLHYVIHCSSRRLEIFYFILFYLFIYLWLHCVFISVRALSSCGKWGLLFVVVCRLLTAVASPQALGVRASVVVACGLSSCGTRA